MKMIFAFAATMTLSFAASAAEVPRDLRHEHLVCRTYMKTRLAQDDAITTTNYVNDNEADRLSWKDGDAMAYETEGKLTMTVNEDDVIKATYKSSRRTTSEQVGDLLTEKSTIKMVLTHQDGTKSETNSETTTIFKVTATGKTPTRHYVDGREIPMHSLIDYSTTLFDGLEVTLSIEKTPYVSNVSPEGYISSILRNETTCVIEQK